jgi:hypothetical protein
MKALPPGEEAMLRTCLAAVALAISVPAVADESGYPTSQCIDSLQHDERLAAIADMVALGRSDQTRAGMFELDRSVVAPERNALVLWSKLRQFCFDLGADFRAQLPNRQQAALADRLFGLHQRMVDELHEGRSTYAEFNRRRVEIYLIAASLEAQMLEGSEMVTSPEGPVLPAGHSEI